MELSMAHHRDVNAPQKLDAAALAQFEAQDDIVAINNRIHNLTREIDGKPEDHPDLVLERSRLYNQKAKRLRAWRSDFIERWWEASYEEYLSGNDFLERDTTPLVEIFKKYLPERGRVRVNLFKKTTLDSETGRQCLEDMVMLCKSTERTVYYPGMSPKDGFCPTCPKAMSE